MGKIYSEAAEVDARLQELKMSRDVLIKAVTVGTVGWLNCSANHPPSLPGIYAWGETVRDLRESLLPEGWERVNDRNFPLTVYRPTGIAVTASSGDSETGIVNGSPRTRHPKGVRTHEVVDDNCRQLGLFEDTGASIPDAIVEVEKWVTWLLLSYRDITAGVVRCELSRPIKVGEDGRVEDWDERILLGSIPFDSSDVQVTIGEDNDGGGATGTGDRANAIDIEVRRRA
jgi:hypothetical protein